MRQIDAQLAAEMKSGETLQTTAPPSRPSTADAIQTPPLGDALKPFEWFLAPFDEEDIDNKVHEVDCYWKAIGKF